MKACISSTIVFATAGLLASCDGGSTSTLPDCNGHTLELMVTEPIANAKVTGDLLVRGTVKSKDGIAVHSVRVAGIDVAKKGFNFEVWETTVSFASLKNLDPVSPRIEVAVEDSCQSSVMAVNVQLKIPVTSLAVAVAYPNGTFAPATKPIPASITVTAAAGSVGGTVGVPGPSGWKLLGLTPEGQVALGGDGAKSASATLSATCSTPAVDVLAQLTVTAADTSATTTLRCAGPPTFQAPAFSIIAGGTPIPVEVVSTGDVAGCQSSSVPTMTATSGAINLAGGTAVTDNTGNGQKDFRVSAAPAATVGTKLQVSCWDSYNQTTQATFEVVAP